MFYLHIHFIYLFTVIVYKLPRWKRSQMEKKIKNPCFNQ